MRQQKAFLVPLLVVWTLVAAVGPRTTSSSPIDGHDFPEAGSLTNTPLRDTYTELTDVGQFDDDQDNERTKVSYDGVLKARGEVRQLGARIIELGEDLVVEGSEVEELYVAVGDIQSIRVQMELKERRDTEKNVREAQATEYVELQAQRTFTRPTVSRIIYIDAVGSESERFDPNDGEFDRLHPCHFRPRSEAPEGRINNDTFVLEGEGYESVLAALPLNQERARIVAALDVMAPMLWLHIPKTGTSFVNTFLHWSCKSFQPNDEIRVLNSRGTTQVRGCNQLWREGAFKPRHRWNVVGDHLHLPRWPQSAKELRTTFITLRHPVGRLASAINKWQKLCEPEETRAYLRATYTNPRHLFDTPKKFVLHMFVVNEITSSLVDDDPLLYRGDEQARLGFLNKAAYRMSRVGFIGVQEYFNTSVCLFYQMYGGEPTRKDFDNIRPGETKACEESITREIQASTIPGLQFHWDIFLYRCGMYRFVRDLCWYGRSCLKDYLSPTTAARNVNLDPHVEELMGRLYNEGQSVCGVLDEYADRLCPLNLTAEFQDHWSKFGGSGGSSDVDGQVGRRADRRAGGHGGHVGHGHVVRPKGDNKKKHARGKSSNSLRRRIIAALPHGLLQQTLLQLFLLFLLVCVLLLFLALLRRRSRARRAPE